MSIHADPLLILPVSTTHRNFHISHVGSMLCMTLDNGIDGIGVRKTPSPYLVETVSKKRPHHCFLAVSRICCCCNSVVPLSTHYPLLSIVSGFGSQCLSSL